MTKKLFDEMLLECATKNYNQGKLDTLGEELKFLETLIKEIQGYRCGKHKVLIFKIEKRIKELQPVIKLLEDGLK